VGRCQPCVRQDRVTDCTNDWSATEPPPSWIGKAVSATFARRPASPSRPDDPHDTRNDGDDADHGHGQSAASEADHDEN